MGEANSNTILELSGAAFGRVDTARRIDNKGRHKAAIAPFRAERGYPMIRIDDILAALILSLFMFRRLEVLTIRLEDNTHLAPAKLEAWRRFTLTGYTLGAAFCAAKVLLSLGWFWLFQARPGWLVTGGLVIFSGWVIGLVWCWRRTTEANAIRVQLQIQRRPLPQKPA